MIALADQSDMSIWPTWMWLAFGVPLALLALAVVIALLTPTNAAATSRPDAQRSRRATNPDCSRRGHIHVKFGDNAAWICGRDGCNETWPVARDVYDQEQEVAS